MSTRARVFLALVLIVLAWAPSIRAQPPCQETAIRALISAIKREPVVWREVEPCIADLREAPLRDANISVVAAAAGIVSRHLQPSELDFFFRGLGGWSHNGRELFSPIFESWTVAAVLALHWHAERRRLDELEELCERWLQAWIARTVLSSTPALPTDISVWVDGVWEHRKREAGNIYVDGLFVDAAGDRSVLSYCSGVRAEAERGLGMPDLRVLARATEPRGRGCPERTQVERSMLGPMATRMLDWSDRFWDDRPTGDPTHWDWVLWLMQRISRQEFHEPSEPEVWGLDAEYRRQLLAFLEKPSPERAKPLIAKLERYELSGDREYRWLYDERSVVTVSNRSENFQNPAFLVVIGSRTQSAWYAPSPYAPEGAPTGFAELAEDRRSVALWSNAEPGNVTTVSLPRAEWGIVWDAGGIRLVEEKAALEESERVALLLRRLEKDLTEAAQAVGRGEERLERLRQELDLDR